MNISIKDRFNTLQENKKIHFEYNLPNGLKELNLITIGLHDWQYPVCQLWSNFAHKIKNKYENFEYYQIPLVSNQWLVNKKLSDQFVGDYYKQYNAQSKFIVVKIEDGDFLKHLEIHNDLKVYVCLMNDEGDIVWETQGHPTEISKLLIESMIYHTLVIEQL